MPAPRPRITIVIPVYNGANYLREAIDSALAQTYPDVEVIVVNDGSSDGGATEAIARSYEGRIRYLSQQNGGVSAALNAGIREMTGDYLSWLSHDDVYLPHKVASQVAWLGSAPEGAVLFSDYEYIDGRGKVLGVKRFRGRVEAMHVELVTGDPVNGCTTLVPRRCFEVCGPFDVSLRTIQDYEMWSRLAGRFPFVHVPEVLVRSRLHPEQGVRTVSTHYAETVQQLARFVEELQEGEIRLVHRGPLSGFYARLALRLKLRGFDEAARVAIAVGRRAGARDGFWTRSRLSLAAAACAVPIRKVKPAYWGARVRNAAPRGAKGGKP
jgi:glycosyltransferase involved in cell wall biosynthesis